MQKIKFLSPKEIKKIFWLFVLILSLTALYFNIKNFNEQTYCFAKVGSNWHYSKQHEAIQFYNEKYSMKKIDGVLNNSGNYKPTFEEIIKYKNNYLLICKHGDWKNASRQ